jgi:cytochrome c oxidase assembly protein subunit 15
MEGRLVPEGYFELTPAYRNFFESVPSVQLHHRALALSTLGATSAFWLYVHRRPVPAAISRCTDLLLACAVGQVSLGVATLLNAVPVWLGSAHQAGALTLFSVTLLLLHTFRRPHDLARTVARFGAARGPSTWVRAQPKVA